MRFVWLIPVAVLLAAPPVAAQISVAPVRDLAFGPVIPGLPTYIGPSRVTAPPLSKVQIRLTLPNQLDGPAGAAMPINFSNNDALHVDAAPNSVPSTFNPKATRNILVTDGTAFIFVGGTVSPTAAQPQGTYSGTITLTINIQ
jgi:hypothetical protein